MGVPTVLFPNSLTHRNHPTAAAAAAPNWAVVLDSSTDNYEDDEEVLRIENVRSDEDITPEFL